MNIARIVSIVLAVLLLLAAATALGLKQAASGDPMHGTLLDPPMPVRPFTLESDEGPVNSIDFRERIVVLFFGFTTCPDVCPTTLVRAREAMRLLGPDAARVQVLLVTVDPERDTPERLGTYVRAFDPAFLGLSGPPARIAEVASAYGIYFARVEREDGGDYTVDHTAAVTVLDRRGEARLIWSFDMDADRMAADLRRLIAER